MADGRACDLAPDPDRDDGTGVSSLEPVGSWAQPAWLRLRGRAGGHIFGRDVWRQRPSGCIHRAMPRVPGPALRTILAALRRVTVWLSRTATGGVAAGRVRWRSTPGAGSGRRGGRTQRWHLRQTVGPGGTSLGGRRPPQPVRTRQRFAVGMSRAGAGQAPRPVLGAGTGRVTSRRPADPDHSALRTRHPHGQEDSPEPSAGDALVQARGQAAPVARWIWVQTAVSSSRVHSRWRPLGPISAWVRPRTWT